MPRAATALLEDDARLDATFAALANATRRAILAQLAEGEASVNDLAAPFDLTLPAISKHIKVLERAGLVIKDRRGREHFVSANLTPAREAASWIEKYAQYWTEQFDAVEAYLQSKKETKQ